MSLPDSLGKPGVRAETLLQESRALEAPFGAPVLTLRPEDYQGMTEAAQAAKLGQTVGTFLATVADGNPAEFAKLSGLYAEQCTHIPYRTAKSAGDVNYVDSHAGYIEPVKGEPPVCGIILAARENATYYASAANLTSLAKNQLAQPPVNEAEARLMTHWHEAAHCAGANEPQAEKMGALVLKKAFPASNLLQVQSDMRMLDTLFSCNDEKRLGNYGWQVVAAIDSVIALPASTVKAMDESAIKGTLGEKFDKRVGAVALVGQLIEGEAPGALEKKDTAAITGALRSLSAKGSFDHDTADIAARSLLALERTTVTPAPDLQASRIYAPSAKPQASAQP